jgi:hypothetical protein
VPEVLFDRVTEIVPRDDREMTTQVFPGFGSDRFRTAITRACKAAGIPA